MTNVKVSIYEVYQDGVTSQTKEKINFSVDKDDIWKLRCGTQGDVVNWLKKNLKNIPKDICPDLSHHGVIYLHCSKGPWGQIDID